MGCCAVGGVSRAGGDAVAGAVGGVAEVAAAFEELVAAHACEAVFDGFLQGFDFEGVSRPFPHVADHVVEAIGIGGEALGGGCGGVAVGGGVLSREAALEDVAGEVIGIVWIAGAPWVGDIALACASGVLPLGLGGEAPADPCGVGAGIVP